MNYTLSSGAKEQKANRTARDMEFVALYNPTLQLMVRRGVKSPRRSAIHFVITNGHPRYHVSFKRAYTMVCQLLSQSNRPLSRSLNEQMWQEIAGRVAELCRLQGVSISCAVEFVLEHCRASRFFISEQYADTIIDRARHSYCQVKSRGRLR